MSETQPDQKGTACWTEILEAILFIGREPIRFESLQQAYPSLTTEQFSLALHEIRRRYLRENRPYGIASTDEGFEIVLRDPFRSELAERLMGQRQIKLNRAAIDVLSVVSYRQPIAKEGVDEIVGFDAGPSLRQLIRRGLIEKQDEGEAKATFVTAPRFLDLFGLESLDDIPTSDELGPR